MPFAGVSQQFWNTTCSNASFLSPIYSGDTISVASQPGCTTPPSYFNIYYYYRTGASVASGTLNFISYTTTANTTFKAYGPFNSLEEGCSTTWGVGNQVATSTSNTTSQTVSQSLVADKVYILEIKVNDCATNLTLYVNPTYKYNLTNDWETEACTDCITGFRPKAGKYIVSGWVKEENAAGTTTTYAKPYIQVTSTGMTTVNLYGTGEIIDGWQRVEGEVTTVTDDDFNIYLKCGSGGDGCYFDDIRVFPYDASMVTYVYDPVSLRLVAELDERNYAKFYEYDEDGKLIRVKKETEKGIMTIQETRENNSKE
jgi:hypothetical protein